MSEPSNMPSVAEVKKLTAELRSIILDAINSVVNSKSTPEMIQVNCKMVERNASNDAMANALPVITAWYENINDNFGGCLVDHLVEALNSSVGYAVNVVIHDICRPRDLRWQPLPFFSDAQINEIYLDLPYIPQQAK